MANDSKEYLEKKTFFDQILTVYGRKPVLEAICDSNIDIFRLHLSDSNRPAAIIDEIIQRCAQRGADIVYHSKKDLSRISKNSKQDQGVAVDLKLKYFSSFDKELSHEPSKNAQHELAKSEKNQSNIRQYIALDGITNPQNLGMVIRSVCASPINGLIIPKQGCAKIDPLVIKASAGTLFRAPIFRSDTLANSLAKAKKNNFNIVALDVNAKKTIKSYSSLQPNIFVLGNESTGLSADIQSLCTHHVKIPMQNAVESLNVAITASLIAFRTEL